MPNHTQQSLDDLIASAAQDGAPTQDIVKLARLLARAERWQESLQWAERALQADDRSAEACRLCGDALLALGRNDEALRCTQEGLARWPKNGPLNAQLALILERRGEVDAAFVALQRAFDRELDAPWVHRVHSRLLVRRGERDAACAALQRAVDGAPGKSEWLAELAALRSSEALAEAAAASSETMPDADVTSQAADERQAPAASPAVEPLVDEHTGREDAPPSHQEQPATMSPRVEDEGQAGGIDDAETALPATADVRQQPSPASAILPIRAPVASTMILVPRRDPYSERSLSWWRRFKSLLGLRV